MSENSAAGDAAARAAAAVASVTGNWRKAGVAGAAIGVIAAGAAAGVAIERLTVGRGMRRKARLALDASGPYGALRGTPGKALSDDGTELYYEIDEVDPEAATGAGSAAGPRRRRLFGRKTPRRSRSFSAMATASTRTPGTSSAPPCADSSVPSTGTSAATAAPRAAPPSRAPARSRSPSTSSAAI